jgi:AcrR family transcriptional regulator
VKKTKKTEIEVRKREANKRKIELRMKEAKNNPGVPAWRGKRHRELRVTGRGGRHGRTMTFFSAAARRLAWEDYEKVSVAMICRDARSTLQTFYKRFPGKPAFEYALVLVSFGEMTRAFKQAMEPETWKEATPQAIVHRLVDEVIANTMTVSSIGVTQLAIRVAMSRPKGAEPYFEFRAAVIDRAVELLSPKLEIRNPKETVRTAIQMLLATATDEAWRHGIPFKTARKRAFVEIYSNLIFRCLGLPPGRRDTKESSAVDTPLAEFPEHLRAFYGITKRYLWIYEKTVNASRKPEFELDIPVELRDAEILETRKEKLKTEKPQNRKRKRISRML